MMSKVSEMPLLEIHYHNNKKLAFILSVLDATVVCSFHSSPYSFPDLEEKDMTYSVANIF